MTDKNFERTLRIFQRRTPFRPFTVALVNGDESGMDVWEIKELRQFEKHMVSEFGACWCLDVGADSWFQTCHDATRFGVLACEVSTFSFDVTKRGRANV